MNLSQGTMDFLGELVADVYALAMELITYHARVTTVAPFVDYPVQARFRGYTLGALSTGVIEPNDEACIIQSALVVWTPGHYDELTKRADGTRWKVIGPIRGRRIRPFFTLQIRQVG